jgi:sortase A
MEPDRSRSQLLFNVELVLWSASALCFSVLAMFTCMALNAHHIAAHISPQDAAAETPDNRRTRMTADWTQSDDGVIGRLEIPAIALSAPITSGIDTSGLLHGIGHIKGTAVPGGLGTIALAGHRDTYLRPLRRIKKGMAINIVDKTGTYHYAVDSTEIVLPEQVGVLAIQSRPELVLITCYPFSYIGAAPKRFVVHAHLISADPEINGD